MTQNPTIKVPPERLEQLKAIGAALDLSIADTVGHLIRAEIERGTISDDLPGIQVRPSRGKLSIRFDDHDATLVSTASAKALADTLAEITAGGVGGFVNIDQDYLVMRQGNGIKITLPWPKGPIKVLSNDVARDLSRVIVKRLAS